MTKDKFILANHYDKALELLTDVRDSWAMWGDKMPRSVKKEVIDYLNSIETREVR